MFAALLTFAAAVVPPQEAGRGVAAIFEEPSIVRGEALGPDGERVAGARAVLVPSRHSRRDARLVAGLWHRVRIPPVLVDPDGGFTLPLTEQHRSVWTRELGGLDLVVEAEGFHRLRVALPGSLEELVSLDVRLAPIESTDRARIELGAGVGRALLVETGTDGEVLDAFVVDVPADGFVEVALPSRLPLAMLPAGENPQVWWRRATLLAPGRSSATTEFERSARGWRWNASRPPEPPEPQVPRATVRRVDGRELRDLRGLYRCPDDVLRWFPLPVDAGAAVWEVPRRDGVLELRALVAAGTCAAAVDAREVELVAAADGPVQVEVVGADGAPVGDAEVTVWALADLDGSPEASAVRPGSLPLVRTVRARAPGRFGFDAPVAAPFAVVVRRRGCPPAVLVDPRGGAPVTVTLAPKSEAGDADEWRAVVTAAGRPLAGVVVHPDAAQAALLTDRELPLVTDAQGMVRLPRPRHGTAVLRCVAPGHAPASVRLDEALDGPVAITVDAALDVRVATVAADGARAPWALLQVSDRDPGGARGALLRTDGRGLAWLRRTPATSTGVRVVGGPGIVPLPAAVDEVVEVTAPDWIGVSVRAPAGASAVRVERIDGRGGASTWNHHVAAAEGRADVRFVVAWMLGRGSELRVGTGAGAPLRITDAEIEGVTGIADRWVELDQTEPVRRIPLRVVGVPAEEFGALRVEPKSPHFGSRMYSDRIGNHARLRDGAVELEFRDRSAASLVVLHPAALPAFLEVPAGDVDGVEVTLEPATPVTFELRGLPADHGQQAVHWMIRGPQGFILSIQDRAPPIDADGVARLRLPVGLPPGDYPTEPLVVGSVTFGSTTVRVPAPGDGAPVPLVVPLDPGG